MNMNDPSGRLFPPPTGGLFPTQPPRGFGPFNTAIPPPGFAPPQNAGPPNWPGTGGPGAGLPPPLHPTNEQVPANLPPRLQLQMLLQIPLTSSQQQQHQPPPQQAPYPSIPSLLDPQPPYHPPPFQQPPSYQGYNQPPPNYGFPSLLSGSAGGSSIPGLGDSQDLERLRALESALKEASRGTWQPPGVAPPPAIPSQIQNNQQETSDAIVARQAEAFIRELQARGQMFDYKHGHRGGEDSARRRRHSSSSSSSGSDFGQRKKRNRRDEGSDLEEGEVEEEAPDTRFLEHHRQQQQLPPPLFGSNQPPSQDYYASTSHIAPLLHPDDTRVGGEKRLERERERERDRAERDRGRGGRRGNNKNYRDLDAQDEDEEGGQAGGAVSGTAAEKNSAGKNSFDKLFSAYLSHKAKTTSKDERPEPAHSPPPAQQPAHPDIAPLLKTLGPSLQQALSAVGIQVPISLGSAQVAQSSAPVTTTTAPSLSYALSAFDRDIAQLGGGQKLAPVEEAPPPLGANLPPNVKVEVAGETSEWAVVAKEITSHLDKPGDQINVGANLPREIHPNRDNRAVVAAVQQMIPTIPMVERENVVQRSLEPPDYSMVPLLLPTKIVEERVFPPLKDTSSAGRKKEQLRRRGMPTGNEAAAPGWSKSELHDKLRQARERVNHLKIEQAMVEERLIVMGDELRKLHRYFESNYGVKLVRPSDLEDPPELIALWKRREEDLRKREAAAADDCNSEAVAAVVYGPEPQFQGPGDDSNEQPDENGPQQEPVGEQNSSSNNNNNNNHMEDEQDESGELVDSGSDRLLKDRREVNRRSGKNRRHSPGWNQGATKQHTQQRGQHRSQNRKGGAGPGSGHQRGGFSRGRRH